VWDGFESASALPALAVAEASSHTKRWRRNVPLARALLLDPGQQQRSALTADE
jgi:hypothetical protein